MSSAVCLLSTEPGIIKVARSWYQWVFNFRWNIGKKFTPRKVHWFGILDPARYLPVPVVQSVTLPNSPIPSMRLIFSKSPSKIELIHGPLKSKENFRIHFRLFHLFCNFFFFPDRDLSSRSSAARFKPLKMTGRIYILQWEESQHPLRPVCILFLCKRDKISSILIRKSPSTPCTSFLLVS